MWNTIIKYPLKSHRKQFISTVLAFSILAFGVIFISQTQKPVEAKGEGSKILTVFENGTRTSFKTDAATIREAFLEQKIEILPEDNVEPSLDEKLTDTDYNVNIYRATPFVIQDGKSRIKVMTAAKTPRKIVEASGLKIFDEDIILSEKSQNPLEDGSTNFLRIIRAKEINVKIFGKEEKVRTQAKTVEEFLKEKKITLTEKDGTSKALSHKIIAGDHFEIWRNGKQTLTVEEETPFETEKIQDASKDVSFREVKTAGEKGRKTATYEIEMKNGVEVSRKSIAEVEIKKAKKQVEVIGTKINLPAGSHTDWMAAAGISEGDFGYANYLVSKESGWRVNATNRSSGAYGIPQALPGSKMASAGADWQTNPITQLRWMNGYVMGRYGSWANAVAHSKSKGWY